MKKLSVLFVSVLALSMTFTSCSEDDDVATVEGKWNFNKYSVTVNGVTTPEQDYYDNEAGCNKDYMLLGANGVFVEGDYITDCALETSGGTWVKTGDDIMIVIDGEALALTVVSVSGSVLKVTTSEIVQGITYTINLSFTKA